ncbi:MAG: BlaI/MecI/CopY family transcriptional regulator [Bdellovibrionales bacterium]|nr:BlaI/MecI/CopY family transcriptional regulator [Bdellovibrionales bacterium]
MSKSKAKRSVTEKLLTDAELELMTILWKRGEGSVADVLESLPRERDLAYTSVSTILRILEQKKIVITRKEGRGHIYIPALGKTEYEAKTVKHMVNRVFDGAPTALVRQLVSSMPLDARQIEELKKIINEAGGKK